MASGQCSVMWVAEGRKIG